MQRVWSMTFSHFIWWVGSSISVLGWVEGKLYHARAVMKYESVHLPACRRSQRRTGCPRSREALGILRQATKSGRSKLRAGDAYWQESSMNLSKSRVLIAK